MLKIIEGGNLQNEHETSENILANLITHTKNYLDYNRNQFDKMSGCPVEVLKKYQSSEQNCIEMGGFVNDLKDQPVSMLVLDAKQQNEIVSHSNDDMRIMDQRYQIAKSKQIHIEQLNHQFQQNLEEIKQPILDDKQ